MGDRRDIVVGFDGSAGAADALRWAIAEAGIRDAPVRVVQSWQDPALGDSVWLAELDHPGALQQRAVADLRTELALAVGPERAAGLGADVIARAPAHLLVEASEGAEMVVVGSRGRGGFATLLLGSVSHTVAGRARCPVVVVRTGPQGLDVVVGVDGTAPSRRALALAADEARRRGARLRVVLAWHELLQIGEDGPLPFTTGYRDVDARAALHRIVADVVGEHPGIEVEEDAVCAPPASALVKAAGDAALLVVAPRSTSLHTRVDLTSVTDQILHHAPCPVAVVHAG